MGFLEIITPDIGTYQGLPTGGGPVISTSNPRTGVRAFQMRPNDSVTIPFTASAEIYARIPLGVFDYRITTLYIDFINSSDGVTHGRLNTTWNLGGTGIYRGTGTLLEFVGGKHHSLYVWNCFEFRYKVSDTVGIFQVKVDGTLIHDFSGDTRNGGTVDEIDQIKITTANGVHMYYQFDDIVVRDDGWPGAGGVHLLVPDSAGDVSDWTASAGNPWDCVDEVPPDFADYIYEDSANLDSHLFNAESLPSEVDSVNAVKAMNVAKLAVAGSGNVRAIAKSGTTTDVGSSESLDTSDKYVDHLMDDDPDTASEWTVSGVNSLQVGAEVT